MKGGVFLAAIFLVLLAGGCAHSAGYTGIHARQTPLGGAVSVEERPWGQPLRVVSDVSRGNPILVVGVEEGRVVHGRVLQETYGRRVYAPWRWYAPFVKIPVSATVVLPVYFAWHDPTPHGLKNWGMTDFLWDFGAWYNWLSAIPNGPREVASSERLIRTREIVGVLSEEIVGVADREVALYLDEELLATATTDAEGHVRFYVGALLTPEAANQDRQIRLVSPRPRGTPAETQWTLSAFVMRRLIERREAEPKAGE